MNPRPHGNPADASSENLTLWEADGPSVVVLWQRLHLIQGLSRLNGDLLLVLPFFEAVEGRRCEHTDSAGIRIGLIFIAVCSLCLYVSAVRSRREAICGTQGGIASLMLCTAE